MTLKVNASRLLAGGLPARHIEHAAMPRFAEGFGVHRAGAEHGPELDARPTAAGLDRTPRSFPPERRLWASFRAFLLVPGVA